MTDKTNTTWKLLVVPETVVIEFQSDTDKMQEAVPALEKIIAADEKLGAEVKKTTASFTDRQRALDQQNKSSATAKLSLDQLSNSVKELNKNVIGNASTKTLGEFATQVGQATTKSTTLVTQLRALRQELTKMEQAGLAGTKAFTDLSIKAGKLQNALGDAAQRIRILASDTKNLDAALSVATGLAGAFAIAQGASALFGKENEELQKALLKVQAALAILNGLQAVAATLNKDSAASVVLLGNAQEGAAVKTGLYGTALKVVEVIQKAFAVSSAAAWAIATAGVSLLIAGVVLLIDHFKDLNQEAEFQKKLQQEIKDNAIQDEKFFNAIKIQSLQQDLEKAKILKASAQEIHDLEILLINERIAGAKRLADESRDADGSLFLAHQNLLKERELIDLRFDEAELDRLADKLEKLDKLNKEHEAKLFDSEKDAAGKRLKFTQDALESDPEIEHEIKKKEFKVRTFQETMDAIQEINDKETKERLEKDLEYAQAFGAIINQLLEFNVDATRNELDALRDKNQKGLISEKEYAKQVAQIERKQAVAEKQKAAFNIALATAEAIIRAFPNGVLMAAAGVLGAVQLAAVASRPLPEIPQFAKGTKKAPPGAKWVGEKGPELVVDPGGYAVLPHEQSMKFAEAFNMIDSPSIIPDLPYISDASMNNMERYRSNGSGINYDLLADKLSERIARHPRLSVNIDEHGFEKRIIEGANRRKSLDDYYKWTG